MTETEKKIIDASTQIKLAWKNSGDHEIFRSCLNSFISSARSITMVMERESKHPELKSWYKEQTSKLGDTPLFKFFNSQRVYTVHKGVVEPSKYSHQISSADFNQVIDEDGKKVLTGKIMIPLDENLHPKEATSETVDKIEFWIFDDFEKFLPDESGNVHNLCANYFTVLKWMVRTWLKLRKDLGINDES